MKNILQTTIISFTLYLNIGCSINNQNTTIQGVNNMQIEKIAQDHGSLTKKLKTLNENFSIELLQTGNNSTEYRRTIAEKLNNVPVVMASSFTELKNTFFVDLLANSATKSIGETLFAHDSKVKRKQMNNKHITIQEIKNPTIQEYLYKIGYNTQTKIIYRNSIFTFENQNMHIEEYFLPSLNKFIPNL